MKILLIALSWLLSTLAYADSEVETQKRNSFLTLSAFECSAVATEPKEQERLFNVGLKAGRDFMQFAQKNLKIYKEELASKVPLTWNMLGGPSHDFVLGQIYCQRVDKVYEEFDIDKEAWKMKKERMYREKIAHLLSRLLTKRLSNYRTIGAGHGFRVRELIGSA